MASEIAVSNTNYTEVAVSSSNSRDVTVNVVADVQSGGNTATVERIKYVCTGTEGSEIEITAAIDLLVTHIVSIARGGIQATDIVTSGTPEGADVKWIAATGILTVDSNAPVYAGEVITITKLVYA